jgi:hypothetical protein
MDVNDGFLQGILEEDIYMTLSLGHEKENNAKSADHSLFVKHKYGMKNLALI